MAQMRATIRKHFIQQILGDMCGAPIVLEELRWRVLQQEMREQKQPVGTMTNSYQKSFNRTLRMFLPTLAPGLRIHKVPADAGWAAGLLARVAVYRLDQHVQLDTFVGSESVSLHFWTNAKTVDIWQESRDGKIDVQNWSLLPGNAPKKIQSLYPDGSRWPRSSPERARSLEQLGPKYVKRPLICVWLCLGVAAVPDKKDILDTIRIPKNLPLSIIGPEALDNKQLESLADERWTLYLRKRGATRIVSGKRRIV